MGGKLNTPCHPSVFLKKFPIGSVSPSPQWGEGEGGAAGQVIVYGGHKNILKQTVLSFTSPSPQPSPLKGEGAAAGLLQDSLPNILRLGIEQETFSTKMMVFVQGLW